MNLSEQEIAQIDRYREGALTASEALRFKLRLEQDADFKAAVGAYLALEDALEEVLQEPAPKGRLRWLIWTSCGAVAAVVVLFLVFPQLFGTGEVRLARNYWDTHPGLPVTMHGTQATLDHAMNAYKTEAYAQSIEILAELPSDTATFFTGCAWFELADYIQSANHFEAIDPTSVWSFEAEYRLALSQLAAGRMEDAVRILERIASGKGAHREAAAQLLEEL